MTHEHSGAEGAEREQQDILESDIRVLLEQYELVKGGLVDQFGYDAIDPGTLRECEDLVMSARRVDFTDTHEETLHKVSRDRVKINLESAIRFLSTEQERLRALAKK